MVSSRMLLPSSISDVVEFWRGTVCKVSVCGRTTASFFFRRRRKIDGHFAVEEERIANGGKNCVAQNFCLGELCERSWSFGSAEGGCCPQEVPHAEGGGNACPPNEGSPRFCGTHAWRCGHFQRSIVLVAQCFRRLGDLIFKIIHSRGVVVSNG